MFSINSIKLHQALSPLRSQRRTYFSRTVNFLFKKNLLLTNSLTSGGFMALGDLIQQEFEFRSKLLPERYEWPRTGRMFIVGACMGPFHHYYYSYLDKLLPKVNLKTVFQKIAADQLFCSPLTIILFFYGMGILENKTLRQCTDEIMNKMAFVYMGDCLFWPPVQFINFYFLRTEYRVVYINFATMIFDIFLSFCKHFDQH